MAVESIVGAVQSLKFGSFWGFANIRRRPADPGTANELLIIWFGDQSNGPAALFTSQLSMALVNGREVRITHQDDSAYIDQIEIRDAPAQ